MREFKLKIANINDFQRKSNLIVFLIDNVIGNKNLSINSKRIIAPLGWRRGKGVDKIFITHQTLVKIEDAAISIVDQSVLNRLRNSTSCCWPSVLAYRERTSLRDIAFKLSLT